MPFFQTVDELMRNPKVRSLLRRDDAEDITGLAALGLWTAGGTVSQELLSDGVISLVELSDACPRLSDHTIALLAGELVKVGMWHARGHSCEHCPQPPEQSWIFHDWFQLRYDTGAQVKLKRGKRRELKDKAICEAVWARDRIGPPLSGGDTVARCRYCTNKVHRKNRREWQYDHVDPFRFIGASNIVIACTGCNKKKADRTPEEAGMTLEPPPGCSKAEWEAQQHAMKVESEGSSHAGLTGPGSAEPLTIPSRDAVPSGGVESEGSSHAGLTGPGSAEPPMIPPQTLRESLENIEERLSATLRQVRGKFAAAESVSTCARARQGVGQGKGLGSGKGSGQGQGEPASSRKRRRRGRKKPPEPGGAVSPVVVPEPGGGLGSGPVVVPAPVVGRAGVAPAVRVEGRFGSPWHNWHGRPPEFDDAICPEHGEHVPCGFCSGEEWD